MSIFVESLKRLYDAGKLVKTDIVQRVVNGKISEEEYRYITGEDYYGAW